MEQAFEIQSASVRDQTLTYISVNEKNSDKIKMELDGRLKHQDALKLENRYACFNK